MKIGNKEKVTMVVIILQIAFLAVLLIFYFCPRNDFLFTASEMESEGIYLENFLESGSDGFYIDSSSEKKLNYVKTNAIVLKPGIYEITMFYRSEGGPQKYLLDAENADFRLWQGNYHKELPSDKQRYTTLIWNMQELQEFYVSCDFSGDGYILFSQVQIIEKRSWVLALLFVSLCLFITIDVCAIRYKTYIKQLNTENNRRILLGLLVIIGFVSYPLFSNSIMYGHDLEFHLLRIEGIKDGLLSGEFPVRIQPNWMNEYGYGVSIFYGDIFLYIPALLRIVGFGVQEAYKIYVFLINILTALLSFYSFNRLTQNHRIGLLGSFIFTSSIYRLNCIYVRAAVGEYTAMAFMPLYFLGIYEVLFKEHDRKRRDWICVAIGCIGMVFSHIITCEIVAIITIAIGIVYYKKLLKIEIWMKVGKCAGTIIGCCAGFLIPFLDMAQDSYVFNSMEGISTIQTSGTTITQLLNMFPSARGEALAYTAIERVGIKNEFTYAIGSVFLFASVFWVYYYVVLKRKEAYKESKYCKHLLLWGWVLAGMTTIWFPWNDIQQKLGKMGILVSNIQFPWRILGIASVILTFFICMFVQVLIIHNNRRTGQICGLMLLAAIVSSSYFLSDRINDNNTRYIQNADDLDSFHYMGGEYIPSIAYIGGMLKQEIETSDNIRIESYQRKGTNFNILCHAMDTNTAYIDLPLLFYRGYTAECESIDLKLTVNANKDGKVRVIIPSGYSGEITVQYQEFWYWRVAEAISVVSILLVLIVGINDRKKGLLMQDNIQD